MIAMIAVGAANLIRIERSDGGEAPPASGLAADVMQPEGPLTLEAASVTADARAREWSEAPTLIFASLQADWPLDPQQPGPAAMPPGGWARFAFADDGEDRVLSIVIERYSGEIVTTESQPWNATRSDAVPVSTTTITSETAIVIAESAYGQGWRLQCPIQRHETDVTLLSGVSAQVDGTGPVTATPAAMPATPGFAIGSPIATDGTPSAAFPTIVPIGAGETSTTATATGPRWLVTYRDGTQQGVNSVEIEIDAMTGQILFIDDQSQGCSTLAG